MMLLAIPIALFAELYPALTHKKEGTLSNISWTLMGDTFSWSWFLGLGLWGALFVWVLPHMGFHLSPRWLLVLMIGFSVGSLTCWAAAHLLIR